MRIHVLSLFRSPKAKAQAELDAANEAYAAALTESRAARRREDTRRIGAAMRSLEASNHRRLAAERAYDEARA
ncbi:hypothetical protein [Brevundimonas sp.]|uniref:hypothetical protein n=1 Tax=Brevundimonas sp. TaxID=1871086 RepID=UPI0028AE24ED|nr:hypothetical protein [Brevundimonas sp.]